MKKIIFLFSLFLVCFSLSAQMTLKTKGTTTLTPTAYSFNVTGSTADSLGVYQDSIIWPINWMSHDSVTFYIRTKITEVTSPANITVQLQAKRFAADSYATIQTGTYTGTGTDTTFVFYTAGTQRTKPYLRLVYIRNANKSYISSTSGWIFK